MGIAIVGIAIVVIGDSDGVGEVATGEDGVRAIGLGNLKIGLEWARVG